MFLFNMPFGVLSLTGAFTLYALAGSPTPDSPGMVEVFLAGLLILAVGQGSIIYFLWRDRQAVPVSLFVYGVVGMSLTGILHHAEISIFIRDIAAFLFLFLPFWAAPLLKGKDRFSLFQSCIIAMGLCFSLRALLPVYGFMPAPKELLYLANSPLVLLSALLLLSLFFRHVEEKTIKPLTILYLVLLIVPVAAMLIDVQRAPLLAVILTIGFLWGRLFYVRPKRGFMIFVMMAGLAYLLYPVWQEIGQELLLKTARVGMNMRIEELQAVYEMLAQDWSSILFGIGWGGMFEAPSVGGVSISYTHSLLSYMLLKGGLIGLVFAVLFAGLFLQKLYNVAQKDLGLAAALFWPFIIPVFLYASYKSLDYGIVLLLIVVAEAHLKGLRTAPDKAMVAPVSRFMQQNAYD